MNTESNDLFYVKIFSGFIVFVIIIIILKDLKAIFVPLFMALLLYFFFNGVVKKLIAKKIPKVFVLFFLLIFIFVVFYLFGVVIHAGVSSFIDKFPDYSEKIVNMIKNLAEQLKIPFSEVNNYINNIDWTKSINTSYITSVISSTFGSFASFIGNLMIVLLFLMFMLAGRSSLITRVNKAFVEHEANKIKFILNSIEDRVQHYLLIKTFVSFLTAFICGLILFFGKIDFLIFSVLLIFFLNFIPNFGSVVATTFPILIGLINYGFSIRILLVASGLMLTQFIVGTIVEPTITGRNLDLSPIVILFSLIFWGWIWGIIGMMLAVPLTSAVKIIFEHIDSLKPIASLISAE